MEFEFLLKIVLASLLGGLFGLSREISGRGGGIRTIFLISTGSALFAALALRIPEISSSADPAVLIGLVICGSGVISGASVLKAATFTTGLLTGAALWASAGIGLTVGLGLYLESFLITILIILILYFFKHADLRFRERARLNAYTIRVKKKISALSDIKKLLMECGINNYEWSYQKVKKGFIVEMTIASSGTKDDLFTEKLMEMDDIEEVSSDNV